MMAIHFPTSVSPLLAVFWGWLALIAYWMAAALFVRKTKITESIFLRLQHTLPMYAAFYLIFTRHRDSYLYGEIYETQWHNRIVYFGILLVAGGFAIAVWARVHLGRYWSGIITLKEGHKVIDTGPYHFVRHPIYTGWLMAALGSAITAGTVDAFVGVVLLTLGFVLKLHREERLLAGELGEEYQKYMDRVPSALIPFLSAIGGGGQTIQSEAFNQAALRSDRYRAIGLLCVCGAFGLIATVSAVVSWNQASFFVHAIVWWGLLAAYEGILLAITAQAQWRKRNVRTWVWAVNTIIECLQPSVALIGLTVDKEYLGPYRALVSSAVIVYALFIILSTLRLSPWLSILAGFVCALGYTGVVVLTLQAAPVDRYRHFMPDRTFVNYPILLLLAGFVAAAVARQIRQHLVAALQEVETRRKLDRIEYDLNVARSIQMGLLPRKAPTVAGYDIAGWSQPADQTGGDYYDWIELPQGRIIVTIADAAGHGIGPALLIAACRAYFRAIAGRNDPLESITAQVDELLAADVPDGRFITAAIALLEPGENRLSVYSAGHGPLFFYSAAQGKVSKFDADQPPLGCRLGPGESAARVIAMEPGDALVLVTDGFFECANAKGEMLGAERLGEAIEAHHAVGAAEMIEKLYGLVVGHSQGQQQADDITAVVIRRRG